MKNVATLMDVVGTLAKLPESDLQALADGLVWFCDANAERLKNCIAYAQQEKDKSFIAQWEREQRANDSYNNDAIEYGVRV